MTDVLPARAVRGGRDWTLYLGDCLDIMREMQGRFAHCITDPPYEEEAHTKARRSLKHAAQKRGVDNRGEVRRIDAPLEISFSAMTTQDRALASELIADRVDGWVLAFCQIEAVGLWRHTMDSAGLDWVRGGVWIKPNGTPQFTGDRPGQGFESLALASNAPDVDEDDGDWGSSIAIAHRPGRKKWNGGGRHAVWTFPLEHNAGGGGKAEHPTIKPLALMLALIADFTQPGDTVIDPFAGSGTTGVACLRLGRKFVGIERDEKFFALATERLSAEERGSDVESARAGQTSIFDALGSIDS